jgi:catechol 2,3-dioxygenase-like lactoylglutathione lyase family enzyme
MKTAGIIWAGLHCEDMQRQLAFYRDVLGMAEIDRGEGYILLDAGAGALFELFAEGKASEAAKGPAEQPLRLAFQVEALEQAIAEIEGEVQFMGAAGQYKNQRWIYLRDPEGNRLALKEVHD